MSLSPHCSDVLRTDSAEVSRALASILPRRILLTNENSKQNSSIYSECPVSEANHVSYGQTFISAAVEHPSMTARKKSEMNSLHFSLSYDDSHKLHSGLLLVIEVSNDGRFDSA